MRKPKYRAWYNNEMRYNVSRIRDGLYCDNGDFDVFAFKHMGTKLMEFIGLCDKDGTEIYEGDRVDTPDATGMVVEWNKKYASFCLTKTGWMFSHWFGEAFEPNDCEVVGNIYENPKMADIINHTQHKEDLEWGEPIQ